MCNTTQNVLMKFARSVLEIELVDGFRTFSVLKSRKNQCWLESQLWHNLLILRPEFLIFKLLHFFLWSFLVSWHLNISVIAFFHICFMNNLGGRENSVTCRWPGNFFFLWMHIQTGFVKAKCCQNASLTCYILTLPVGAHESIHKCSILWVWRWKVLQAFVSFLLLFNVNNW